jgi:hypothetical protein
MRSLLAVFALTFVTASGAETRDALVHRLVGSFSNADQARSDFSYHTVSLHSAEIWPQRVDGPWIYLEQSLEEAPGIPYRQQVYQLAIRPDGTVEIRIYTPTDPLAWTGAWKDPTTLPSPGPEGLRLDEGCTVKLSAQTNGSLKGSTEGCACRSELRNADYATTELTISDAGVVIWDRGFSTKGNQVWGPSHGGFDFRRTE